MAAVVAVQGTIIPAAVATPFLAETTIVVSGLFYCFSSVVAIIMIVDAVTVTVFSVVTTTIVAIGLSGLSLSPSSVVAITAAANQNTGRCKNRPF